MNNSKAQYSYTGVDIGYTFTKFKKGNSYGTEGIVNHQVKSIFNLMHRPVRNFAVGLSIGVPVYEKFRWTFSNSETNARYSSFDDPDNTFSYGEYTPSQYNYDIHLGVSKTLVGRLYFDVETNFYLDVRYNFMTIEESFTFVRYGNYATRHKYNAEHKAKGPGFSVGYTPRLGDNFFFNYQFAMDFYKTSLRRPSFSYDITYNYDTFDNVEEKVTIESPIEEKEISYLFVMGFMYAF